MDSPVDDVRLLLCGNTNVGLSAIVERYTTGKLSSSRPANSLRYGERVMMTELEGKGIRVHFRRFDEGLLRFRTYDGNEHYRNHVSTVLTVIFTIVNFYDW